MKNKEEKKKSVTQKYNPAIQHIIFLDHFSQHSQIQQEVHTTRLYDKLIQHTNQKKPCTH